ncbi:hydrogenase formation protein HypD [Fervidibacter sacchari]|uniref:Hydrogenase expression/formation protein HypD n=1 Tax=Candidatus Fervidibacter sacchari TaxID=1448929 RepID=A0ABT2ELM1_9BACT|nr:hydrogenase formation protein HypD [Candidatus Fervidibacter sacchari]MCS3918839.1 hydrogenase expression/formation protein HypD [Candidatus Fervidibacter sacchari]WKU17415.1 hydrogenase formation protein HypD [Candidatus Fervidibacter sacchari]
MRFIDEFRDSGLAKRVVREIERIAEGRRFRIMEICGGHTHTIYRYGLHDVLPTNIELVHGPGCPVCVLPMGKVDDAIAIAKHDGVILATFGDMMRVPGSKGSLMDAQADGADVRMVYSPLDALKLAHQNPDRKVVFFAIGFETTAPSTAVTLMRAKQLGIRNFFVFCNHVLVVPAIKALLDSPETRLDGFIGPGHVTTVIGSKAWEFIPRDYGKGIVISGFEPLDMLQAIYMLVRQLVEGKPRVDVQYTRAVRPDGNTKAKEVMARVFDLRDTFEWRGLGWIEKSALKLKPEFAEFDAELHFELPRRQVADPKVCQCGEVLRGAILPWECKVFGTACTPEHPIGACMVSSEGACAAVYQYGRYSRKVRELLRHL